MASPCSNGMTSGAATEHEVQSPRRKEVLGPASEASRSLSGKSSIQSAAATYRDRPLAAGQVTGAWAQGCMSAAKLVGVLGNGGGLETSVRHPCGKDGNSTDIALSRWTYPEMNGTHAARAELCIRRQLTV